MWMMAGLIRLIKLIRLIEFIRFIKVISLIVVDANQLVGWQVNLRFMKYLNNAIEIYTNKWNFIEKNAAKDRKRAKYGDRSLKKAFR